MSHINCSITKYLSTLLYEIPSNSKGKNFVSKIYCYCPLQVPSASKYPQILIELPAEGKCPHILIESTCRR